MLVVVHYIALTFMEPCIVVTSSNNQRDAA